MEYYKTAGGMFAAAFSEAGYLDGDGNPIQPEQNDSGMTEDEYLDWKKGMLKDCLEPFTKEWKEQDIKQSEEYIEQAYQNDTPDEADYCGCGSGLLRSCLLDTNEYVCENCYSVYSDSFK